MEDHCGKAGRSKVNRLLAKQTRLFSYIEGLQAETRVYYTLWQCGPELRILVSGEAGPAVRCTFPADMECRARNLLQYLYENTVMPSQAADVLADCCTVGQVKMQGGPYVMPCPGRRNKNDGRKAGRTCDRTVCRQ